MEVTFSKKKLRNRHSAWNSCEHSVCSEILTGELSQWIQMSFKHYAMQEAKQQFVEYDKNGDGTVTWDEYNIQMYDRVIDFDENTALDDTEEESFRQVGPSWSFWSYPVSVLSE